MKVDKSKWEVKKLGKVCNILNGYAFKSNLFKEDGERIIRISNINNGFIDIADAVYFNIEDYNVDLSKFVIYKNDILIALSGATTGKIGKYILDNISYLNQRVGLIRSKNNISNSFLYYYMRNKTKESLSLAYGVAQPNLSTKTIQNYVIPVPPLPEQQAIASELNAIQSLITKYKEQLNDYDNLAKSIFNEMFGDVVSNDNGWEYGKLKDITVMRPSKKEGITGLNYSDSVSFLPMEDIEVNSFRLKPVKEKSLEDALKGSYTYFGNNDVLLAKVTPCFENGKIAIAKELINGIGFGTSEIIVFRPKDKVISDYLYFVLSTEKFHKEGTSHLTGVSGLRRLEKSFIDNYNIPLPPLPLQQAFAARITAIESQKDQVKQQITDLQTLFDSRMQYYFD